VIGGISMGAAIAMRVAALRPDLVAGLVIARPAWAFEPAPESMTPILLVGRLLQKFSPEEAMKRFDASDVAEMLSKEAPDNYHTFKSFISREPVAVTAELLTRMAKDGPGISRQQASAISCPTLVIGHDVDYTHPMAMAQDIANTIPTATLAKITPKAQNVEAYRDDMRAAMAGFLQSLPA
jgi:pimeloyl-ACP methyl ester carboxylesterase